MSYSPDSRRLVSGTEDETARVWDAESGECLEAIEGEDNVIGTARSIGGIAGDDDAQTCRAINRGQEMVVDDAVSGQQSIEVR